MEQDWFFYLLTLFTFVVIFGMCYIRHKYTFFERNKIPSAPKPRFPFGNIYDVIFKQSPMFMQLWKFYNGFKRKKCKLFGGFYVYLKPALVIMDSEFTKILLSSNSDFEEDSTYRSRDFNEKFSDKLLKNIFSQFLRFWPSLGSICQNFPNEEVNISEIMKKYVVEVSERQLLCLKEPSNNFEPMVASQKNDFLKFSKIFGFQNATNREKSVYKNHLDRLLMERKENSSIKDDVVQVFSKEWSTLKIVDHIFGLIYNLNVSSNLIVLSLYELALNSEIQDDLRGEILRFKKCKTIASIEDLKELSYLDSVVREILRKYPFQPFFYKICARDYEYKNVNIPKDVLLFVPTFAVHHDAQNYPNPEVFDPDRFSEENEKFVDPVKYLPFGYHEKTDFDSRFATMIMKLMLIEFISTFKISLSKKSPKSLTFDESICELKSKDDMWLKLEKLS